MYAAAARLSENAFRDDPKLAEKMEARHRYNAACSAAVASAGQEKDDPKPNVEDETRLRKLAMEWRKAYFAFWIKFVANASATQKGFVKQTIQHWKTDADLAGVRDEGASKTVTDEQQKDWRAFWKEVDEVLEKLTK